MLSLHDMPSMLAALDLPLDPTLHRLLADRIHDTIACGLGDMTHIIVVEPGDREADFLREAAFSPFWNPTLPLRYGEVGFEPPWDWAGKHDGWFEWIKTVGNSGFAFIVLVPDREEIDPTLAAMCKEFIP
jgi:hypothetical protein